MPEEGKKAVHPGSWVGDTVEEVKKLPTWGKFALAGVVILVIGIAIYERNKAKQGSSVVPGTTGSSSLFGGSQLPGADNSVGSTGSTGSTDGPPPTTTTTTTPAAKLPGSTFLGPTGVNHYVATGNQSLSQIAQLYGLQSWNSIYAIPDNQKLFGALNTANARTYTPKAGTVITLPGGATRQGNAGPSPASPFSMTTLMERDYFATATPHVTPAGR
jgi:hypothetical protein